MDTPSRDNLAKSAFVLSMVVLAVGYGWMSRTEDWFPNQLLVDAYLQGQREVSQRTGAPDFTTVRAHRESGITVSKPDSMQPGLTLVVSTWEHMDWNPGLVLMDASGNVVHQWTVEPTELFSDSLYRRQDNRLAEQDIHGSYLFDESGDVLVNVEYAGTARLDACGRVKWKVENGNHHSIHRADDGSFWIPGVSGLRPARSEAYPEGYPGIRGPIYQDYITRVSPDGRTLEAINVMDVLYDNGLERHIPKFDPPDMQDITHLNDIEPLSDTLADEHPMFEAGDLLLSMPSLDLVAVYDPDSGRVKWHVSHPIIAQHDPDWMADGWVGIFDNNEDGVRRGRMLGGSRILAVKPGTDSTRVLYPTGDAPQFYTGIRGKWDRLANGNILAVESAVGRVVEATPDGRTVWEFIAPPYSSSHVPNVTDARRVDLTREDVAEWPCSNVGSNSN